MNNLDIKWEIQWKASIIITYYSKSLIPASKRKRKKRKKRLSTSPQCNASFLNIHIKKRPLNNVSFLSLFLFIPLKAKATAQPVGIQLCHLMAWLSSHDPHAITILTRPASLILYHFDSLFLYSRAFARTPNKSLF